MPPKWLCLLSYLVVSERQMQTWSWGSTVLTGGRCFWTSHRTHQQVPQGQLLRAAPALVPTEYLKGQNLPLAAIILKHLKLKDSYFRGLRFLNLHMLLL